MTRRKFRTEAGGTAARWRGGRSEPPFGIIKAATGVSQRPMSALPEVHGVRELVLAADDRRRPHAKVHPAWPVPG